MKSEVDIIWRKGDGKIPPEAKYVVDTVRGEMLLKSLELPGDITNEMPDYKKSDFNRQI